MVIIIHQNITLLREYRMSFTSNQLIDKCVFLDSSSIIRHINKVAKESNRYVDYHQLRYDQFSFNDYKPDNSYYDKITSLLNKKGISAFITYETNHIFEFNNNYCLVQLFKSNSFQQSDNRTVFLNQSVNRGLFYLAAQQILEATKIIIDPLFLDFQIGINLSNYIKSSCHVISLGKRIILQKYENEISVLSQSPDEYVELFLLFNLF